MIPSNLKYVLESEPEKIAEWLEDKFTYEVPAKIETMEDMEHVSELMSAIMNSYSYISNLTVRITIFCNSLKAECGIKPDANASREEKEKYRKAKAEYEKMSLKRRILEQRQDILNKEYHCLSRKVTIKSNVDNELHMSDVH